MSANIEYVGKANVRKVFTGKESIEDQKELMCNVKIGLSNVPIGVVDILDPMIGEFMFNSSGMVRNPLIGPISIQAKMEGYRIGFGSKKDIPATIKRMVIYPSDGKCFYIEILLAFPPDGDSFIEVAEALSEEVDFSISSINKALF